VIATVTSKLPVTEAAAEKCVRPNSRRDRLLSVKSARLKQSLVLVFVTLAVSVAIPLFAAQPRRNGGVVQVPADAGSQPPLCDPSLIDATFAYFDPPGGEQTVTFYFQNKGNVSCRLEGPPNPSFAVDGHSMIVETCPFCGRNGRSDPTWGQRQDNEVVLAPGATTAIDMNWSSTGTSCQWADWGSIFFNWMEASDWHKLTDFLFIPSGWPMRICSSVRSFGYRTAADSPFTEEKTPAIRVSVLPKTLYSDERATLHIELNQPAQSSVKPVGCASLYTVRHTDPLQTRLDPLRTEGSSRVDSYTPEQMREDKERAWPQWKTDFKRECDIAAGRTSADAEMAASDLATVTHIELRTAPAPDTKPAFLSVATHFDVLDVDSLPSNWGEPVKGIRAGLSVDEERFTVGELVPVHLRWKNVNASDPLAQGECNAPKPDLEIQDSQHHVLKTIAPNYFMCNIHGWGPFEMPKGKALHTFQQLTTAPGRVTPFDASASPIFPSPGIYYLVSVWSPYILDKTGPNTPLAGQIGGGKLGGIYATARSVPVRIEVMPSAER
jgi:hypothetical protein